MIKVSVIIKYCVSRKIFLLSCLEKLLYWARKGLISRMFSNVTFRRSSCADAVICSFAFHQMAIGVVFWGFFLETDLSWSIPRWKPYELHGRRQWKVHKTVAPHIVQKFIISKGTADDKISRKFETLQRKLHVSQKQYLGQNESDKCVTWLEITLWIYQCVTVQFLLIVRMEPRVCCHWCEQKKTRVASSFY